MADGYQVVIADLEAAAPRLEGLSGQLTTDSRQIQVDATPYTGDDVDPAAAPLLLRN